MAAILAAILDQKPSSAPQLMVYASSCRERHRLFIKVEILFSIVTARGGIRTRLVV